MRSQDDRERNMAVGQSNEHAARRGVVKSAPNGPDGSATESFKGSSPTQDVIVLTGETGIVNVRMGESP
jgi:hypothetical protein